MHMSDRSDSPDGTDNTHATNTAEPVEGNTTLAALSHLSALVASFIGPLFFLVIADNDDELATRNAKNSLNFQILVLVALLISALLALFIIGGLLIPFIFLADLVLVIIATLKANDGEVYSYPFTPEFF
jgi:uncharacterized Tic20 family protein